MVFEINNRRYTGSKFKIREWIRKLIKNNCSNCDSFCDIFAGTGVITSTMINDYNKYILNDILYSNEVIYKAFFSKGNYREDVLYKFYGKYKNIDENLLVDNYVSENYGDKYFSLLDAKKIGYIREDIELNKGNLLEREYNILLTSLVYSFDRCANTVGHYEAYFKNKQIKPNFEFELVSPIVKSNSDIDVEITREDANILCKKKSADIVYIDPPYSSRQYSRFYHVIETIIKWDKPELFGVARKPIPENMSEYCTSKAIDSFRELIYSLDTKYIVVSYNNTYDSKSKSSENKMTLEQIKSVLSNKGKTDVFSKKHSAFNAGKTNFKEHKEFIFITKVGEFDE